MKGLHYAGFQKKSPYLDFEREFTAAENEAWMADRSEENRLAALAKRIEAKKAWEALGNTVPPNIKFSTR